MRRVRVGEKELEEAPVFKLFEQMVNKLPYCSEVLKTRSVE
jgi:hypothetical protein